MRENAASNSSDAETRNRLERHAHGGRRHLRSLRERWRIRVVRGPRNAKRTAPGRISRSSSSLLASSGPIVAAALFDWPRITLGDVTELLSAFVGAIVEFFKSLFDW
jgi:hypothetical protein